MDIPGGKGWIYIKMNFMKKLKDLECDAGNTVHLILENSTLNTMIEWDDRVR